MGMGDTVEADALTGAPDAHAARRWHPLCDESALGTQPLAARLFGHDVVVWRNGRGAPSVLDDQCPHRGARLSLGRVQGDALQCAYHGWCFDAAGACVRMPSQPDLKPAPTYGAGAWQVALAHGLVWAARDPVEVAPPALAGVPSRRVICGPYDVATSAPRLVENFLDTSHFGFVHEGFLGDAEHTAMAPYAVASTADGRPCIEDFRTWQPRPAASSAGGAWVAYRYEVLAPYAALLQKKAGDDGIADAYALFACPRDEEASRVWFVQFTTDTATPDAELRAFQDVIFSQDRPVLESQRPRRLPLSGTERHAAADRLSVAYRRWLQAQRVDFGVC